MKKSSENISKIPCDYWEFKSFTGIVIIPIKDNVPVLIFKDYGAPFYREMGGPNDKRSICEQDALNNYFTFWKGKYWRHKLPRAINQQYGDYFDQLISSPVPTHFDIDSFPSDSIEMPISLLRSKKIKVHESENITYAKRILRDLDFISEGRGKNKKENEFKKYRARIILAHYRATGRKRPYNMSYIQNKTSDDLARQFPDKSTKEIMLSDDQVRRILNKHTLKNRMK